MGYKQTEITLDRRQINYRTWQALKHENEFLLWEVERLKQQNKDLKINNQKLKKEKENGSN